MFDFAVAGGEPGADFLWIVMEWAHAAAIGDAGGLIDDVETLGPGGVGVVGGVGHVVHTERQREIEAFGEIVGDGEALFQRLGLSVADVFFEVGFHLPFVGGMGFADVDGQKVGVIFVIVEDLDEVADLATERRSSKAAEDEDERLGAGAFTDVKTVGAVEREETRVGSGVADFEIASVHVRQGVADHVEGVPRAASHDTEHDESDHDECAEADADPHGDFPHEGELLRANLARKVNSGCDGET